MRTLFLLALILLLPASLLSEASIDKSKLLGKWCYTHSEVGGEVNEENIPYEFLENGEFTFKNSSMASVTRTAKYKIEGEKLNIGGLAPGGLKILSLSDEKMLAEWMFGSKWHFKRGECS